MLVFLPIQKKVIYENHVFNRDWQTIKSIFGRSKNRKRKLFRSFFVFFHLVFKKLIKSLFFQKLWPLKLFKRQNGTFSPKRKWKKFSWKSFKNPSKWWLQLFKSLKKFFIMSWVSGHTPIISNFDELLLRNCKTPESLVTMKSPLFVWII